MRTGRLSGHIGKIVEGFRVRENSGRELFPRSGAIQHQYAHVDLQGGKFFDTKNNHMKACGFRRERNTYKNVRNFFGEDRRHTLILRGERGGADGGNIDLQRYRILYSREPWSRMDFDVFPEKESAGEQALLRNPGRRP
jgi:hypothetical protein